MNYAGLVLALCALALTAACGSEPPASAANAPAAAAQAQSAPQAQPPASRPSEPAPARTPAEERRVAQADTAPPADNSRFVAGQHYTVLNPAQPTNVAPGKVEVVDVFWYGCGGCYVMFPYMEAWKESKPEAAEYVQLPAVLNPGWQPHARLYFATKALGIEDKTHAAIFREYHQNRNPLNTTELMVEFLGRFDVSADDARDLLTPGSPGAFSLEAFLRDAEVRARRYQLRFVPAFVVNGKYVFGVDQAGGPEAVPELINHLVAQEARQ
jgi:protein dithiol oxidoreductase (disulfide-forming)